MHRHDRLGEQRLQLPGRSRRRAIGDGRPAASATRSVLGAWPIAPTRLDQVVDDVAALALQASCRHPSPARRRGTGTVPDSRSPRGIARRCISARRGSTDACASPPRGRNGKVRAVRAARRDRRAVNSRSPSCERAWKKSNAMNSSMHGSRAAKARDARPASTVMEACGNSCLQAADRRQRGNEVADMVELDHQDAFDLVGVEHGMPGGHHLRRLVVRPIVVGVAWTGAG